MHSSSLGTPPGICLPSQCHHKKSYSQPESLSQLRFHHVLPPLASTRMVSRSTGPSLGHYNKLPKRRDLLRQPHFHRFHDNLPLLRLAAWRLSSVSPVRQASLRQWLAILPSVGDILDWTVRLAGESYENGAESSIIGPPSPQF